MAEVTLRRSITLTECRCRRLRSFNGSARSRPPGRISRFLRSGPGFGRPGAPSGSSADCGFSPGNSARGQPRVPCRLPFQRQLHPFPHLPRWHHPRLGTGLSVAPAAPAVPHPEAPSAPTPAAAPHPDADAVGPTAYPPGTPDLENPVFPPRLPQPAGRPAAAAKKISTPDADPYGPTMPPPAPSVDPHAPTVPAPAPSVPDPHAPTVPAPANGAQQAAMPQSPSTLQQVGRLLPAILRPGRRASHLCSAAGRTSGQVYRGQPTGRRRGTRRDPDYIISTGTPEQLAAIQDEIGNLLAARAQAETAEAIDGRRGSAFTRPIGGRSNNPYRTPAQSQRPRRTSSGSRGGRPNKPAAATAATGIAGPGCRVSEPRGRHVRTDNPAGNFETFTSYASRASRRLRPEHAANERRCPQYPGRLFAQMAVSMATQNEAQPARQQELAGDAGRLDGAGEQAVTSEENLQDRE